MAGLPGTMIAVSVEVSEKAEDRVEDVDMTAEENNNATKGAERMT